MGCNCGKKSGSIAANPVGSTQRVPVRTASSSAPPVVTGFRRRAKNIKENMVVSDEEKERRLTICRECPHFRHKTTRCGQCGCFLNIKAKLAIVNCPIGQW